jgi:hypothetical protein
VVVPAPAPEHPSEVAPDQGLAWPWTWPWAQIEPGYDKCKRRKPWPLPLWCSGLSSWPVRKAQAVTASVRGIRDAHGERPPA